VVVIVTILTTRHSYYSPSVFLLLSPLFSDSGEGSKSTEVN